MIRIGDFSKLSRVSVKTLRYYDEMGLLKPVEVDPFTGYRFYLFSQLTVLHRILALGLQLGQFVYIRVEFLERASKQIIGHFGLLVRVFCGSDN